MIPYKNVISQKIVDNTINQKKCGPFTVDLLELGIKDMYKFMLYTLLKQKFTLLSSEYMIRIRL